MSDLYKNHTKTIRFLYDLKTTESQKSRGQLESLIYVSEVPTREFYETHVRHSKNLRFTDFEALDSKTLFKDALHVYSECDSNFYPVKLLLNCLSLRDIVNKVLKINVIVHNCERESLTQEQINQYLKALYAYLFSQKLLNEEEINLKYLMYSQEQSKTSVLLFKKQKDESHHLCYLSSKSLPQDFLHNLTL